MPTDAHDPGQTERRRVRDQDHGLDQALDQTLIQLAEGALEDAHPVRLELPVRNVNRTVGTLLGSEVTRRYGAQGLPDDTIHVTLTGSAGQSIGAFLPPGITLELIGDANDYVGKGLSGGRVIVRPPDDVLFLPEDNVIAGNTLLFGATSGEVYLRGRVGERFCARNSGALAVVEGVGDHACEYMTGGRVVVLGKTGRNMAAGMSGGIAFVLGLDPAMVNTEMVELQRLEPEDLTWLRDVIAKHARLHRQHGGHVGAVRLAKAQCAIHQDHAHRLPARPGGHPDGQGGGPRRRHRDHGGEPWLIRTDSWRYPRSRPPSGRSTSGSATGARSTNSRTRTSGPARCRSRPAGAWTAESRSATREPRAVRWATSSPSGTTWSGGAAGTRPATACTPPTTSRSSPAGCAPRRARRPACCPSPRSRPAAASRSSASSRPSPTRPGWTASSSRSPPPSRRARSVAVVGSGPAGLAAAQQLTRAGHDVTVYERDDRIGGLMRYGIPEYKLEKATLNQRLAQMRAEGTRFVTDCEVGVDLSVEQLREQYDAVVLAVGALRARDNEVEGRHLDGVHLAMEHLVPANKECEGDGAELDLAPRASTS